MMFQKGWNPWPLIIGMAVGLTILIIGMAVGLTCILLYFGLYA